MIHPDDIKTIEPLGQEQPDPTPDPSQVKKKVDGILNLSKDLKLPVQLVEENFELIQSEKMLSPQDPEYSSEEDWARLQAAIGLREHTLRMDFYDWAAKVPFSPTPVVQLAEIQAAASRLKNNDYEKPPTLGRYLAPGGEPIKRIQQPAIGGYPTLLMETGMASERHGWTPEGQRRSDEEFVTNYLLKQQEIAERGQSFAVKVFEGVSFLPKWMIEFALTGGLANIGNKTAQEVGLKLLKSYSKTAAGRTVLRSAGWVGGAITRATLGLPHRVAEEILKDYIGDTLKLGPNNEIEFYLPEKNWASYILRNWGKVVIEAASEDAGGSIVGAEKYLFKKYGPNLPIAGKIISKVQNMWMRKTGGTKAQFIKKMFEKGGWHGILGEWQEEDLNWMMASVLGADDYGAGPDAGPIDRFKAAFEQEWWNIEQLGLRGVVLSVPGAAKVITVSAVSAIDKATTEFVEGGRVVVSRAEEVETPTAETLQAEPRETIVQQKQRDRMFSILEEEIGPQKEAQLSKGYLTQEEYDALPTKTRRKLEALGNIQLLLQPQEETEESGTPLDEYTEWVKNAKKEIEQIEETESKEEHRKITQPIIDQTTLEETGNAVAKKLGVEGEIQWVWSTRKTTRQMGKEQTERPSPTGEKKYKIIVYPEHSQHKLETGEINQEELLDTVIEELGHIAKPPYYPPDSIRKRIHSPEFKRWKAEAIRTINEEKEITKTVATMETVEATQDYIGENTNADLTVEEPSAGDIGFISNFMHNYGIKEKEGYEPLGEKDFRNIYKFLQMPEDIRHAHPEFDAVYQAQRGREVENVVLNTEFLNSTRAYFNLSKEKLVAVDKALIQIEQDPKFWADVDFKTPTGRKYLKQLGLDQAQIEAITAMRTTLDDAGRILTDTMEEYGVKDEYIDKFREQIKNYVPHKWFGNWAVVVKEEVEVEEGVKSTKTVFMSATNYMNRFKERDRLKKIYPKANVEIVKRTKIPTEAFQAVSPLALHAMIDTVIERANLEPEIAGALSDTLNIVQREKGFGAHFIQRKNVPGWEENLRRPLAEYFTGLAGFITRIHAMPAFSAGLSNTKNKPNLYGYTSNYINYVMSSQFEFQSIKRALYTYYLWGNIKSAALNLTQNFILGWPVLSKHTNLALPKLMMAMARTAIPNSLRADELGFLQEMEKQGYLVAQLSQEIAGQTGNPMLSTIKGKISDKMALFDVFRMMEEFNRKSMAVALYNAGIDNPHEAAMIIEEAHYHYGKGNRYVLARGNISPISVFRSWGINYAHWLKNQIKEGNIKSFAKSVSALIAFGGLAAIPGWEIIKKLWEAIFGENPETVARDVLGETIGGTVMGGLPTLLPIGGGISFTGSVGQADMIPTELSDIPGVLGDIPGRISKVHQDIKSGDYRRAIEDASPEVLRNPLAAYRMYKYGQFGRSGNPFIDLTTGELLKLTKGEAAIKAMGFQPESVAKAWRMGEAIELLSKARKDRKQNWANRYILSKIIGDDEASDEVINELVSYNNKMMRQSKPEEIISRQEWDSLIRSRIKAANIPPKYLWPQAKELIKKWEGEPYEPETVDVNLKTDVGEMGVDLYKIWGIESSHGSDPKMNEGAHRGHYQFSKATWDEVVEDLGEDWDWKKDSKDYKKSTKVADYYFNKRIPEMLEVYDIPDTIETRIAVYNWGIGNLNKAWKKYKEDWIKHAPKETKNYIKKYLKKDKKK